MWSCRYCWAAQSPTNTRAKTKTTASEVKGRFGRLSNCAALSRFAGENEQSGLLKTTFCAKLAPSKLKERGSHESPAQGRKGKSLPWRRL